VPPPDVSIVVVNYRTEEMSTRALGDAVRSAAPRAVEQIVVDNGATEDSVAALKGGAPDARIVALGDNRGFAAAVNAGAAAAQGRYLLILNSDAFAKHDAVARLAAYLDGHPQAGVVAPVLRHADGSLQINAYRRFPNLVTLFFEFCLPLHPLHGTALHPHALPRKRFSRPGPVAHAMGAALLVRREAFDQAGPLDERFFLYLEETEWQRRVARAGWEIHLEPAAEVAHLERASSGEEVVSSHYFASAQRYFGRPRAARWVMRTGAGISVLAARAAAAVRPGDPRFPKLVRAFRRVRESV
jgi:N-acetylglucosaminyl-diphospho-decaprenol L-rhamnosyltransferase